MSKLKCTMCGKKLKEYNAFNINHQFTYASKYDGDMLNICLCPVCLDRVVNNIKAHSKVNPITKISKVS
jgi:hypothetical protein